MNARERLAEALASLTGYPADSRTVQAFMEVCQEYAEQTAAERAAEAWGEGHKVGWEHCQDGNYGNDYWDDDTANPYGARAAALTEEQR